MSYEKYGTLSIYVTAFLLASKFSLKHNPFHSKEFCSLVKKVKNININQFWKNMLCKHFNAHLIISFNRYFDSIIKPVPFWDFPLLLNLSQSNLSKPLGTMAIIAFILYCVLLSSLICYWLLYKPC